MAYWLVKSEPASWSWAMMVAAGEAGTAWTGVRNHLAKNHLKAMAVGERAFFYHSNEGKEIVGLVEVIAPFAPDPTDESGRFGKVDVRAVAAMPRPVALAEIRGMPECAAMMLVTNSRISVQPVSAAEWMAVCRLGGFEP